ncbi:PTS sugar transporter subunit IIA [Enterococcus faecium]|nr:PTS sugar transporter subunit IIA [Enterococcus faecium]
MAIINKKKARSWMDDNRIITPELVLIKPDVSTTKELLALTAERLLKMNYVKSSFGKAVIKREENFPTGIRVGEINVAIPHTDAVHVNNPAIAMAILDTPIYFGEMGAGKDSKIPVSIVLNMAINDGNEQVEFLRKIMSFIQDQEELKKVLRMIDKNEIAELLNEKLM